MPGGRPAHVSRDYLERVAFDLFARRGFSETTVEMVAEAAGVARRTFFRYFRSKNDVVWGNFEEHLEQLRARLEAVPSRTPLAEALRVCIVGFNEVPPGELRRHRKRMELILTVPELQADSALRYSAWKDTVAEFAGARLGEHPRSLRPQVIARCALGAAIAAYEHWLASPSSELSSALDEALRFWLSGVAAAERAANRQSRTAAPPGGSGRQAGPGRAG
jgi:mycofactocin system transcriptional regulator